MVKDLEQTTFRPLQIYTGALDREYVDVGERGLSRAAARRHASLRPCREQVP
jgi:hypothetical protein